MTDWNIRIGFSASSGLGDIIRQFTGGDCNHAFILYFDDIFQTTLTLGANANGLTIEPLFNFPDQIVHTFAPLQAGFEKGLRLNTRWLNQPYDYGGLIGMAEVEAAHKLGDWKAVNPFLNERELFCSEYASMIVRDSAYAILPQVPAGSIDPNQLCQAMLARPEWFTHKLGV